MATTVASLLTKVRRRLSDEDKQRWNDDRLLESLNEGITDIVAVTQMELENIKFVAIEEGLALYDLSDIALKITRVEWDSQKIPVITHNNMDSIKPGWSEDIGSQVEAAIYDRSRGGAIKLYPIPSFTGTQAIVDAQYGTVTAIYGSSVITLEVIDGIPTGANLTEYIKVYFIARETIPLTINDTIPLDTLWDQSLRHYIAFDALRDNFDAQSKQTAQEEYQLYTTTLSQRIKFRDSDDRTKSKRNTTYNKAI